ncbi:MAG TPA: hypothetical protein VM241_02290 [Candidatus Thermoplasmatota archaeon]|nr:hypothetical protein [Candidatus Thermoplasmatota archaeon]
MQNRSGWAVALLTTLALTAPAVTAGTAAAPEITDASGDGSVCIQAPACATQDFLDVKLGWVDVPDATHVAFHLEVAGAAPASGAGVGVGLPDPLGFCAALEGSVIYTFHFQAQDPAGAALFATTAGGDPVTDQYLVATRPCDTAAAGPGALDWGFYLAYAFTNGGQSFLSQSDVTGSIAGNQFTWVVERSAPSVNLPAGPAVGYKLANLAATSGLYVALVAVTDSSDFVADQAPDTGVGLPFAFGAAAAKPIYSDLTTAAFTLAAKNPTKTNQTYVYNWTNAQADVDVTFGAAARAGTAHVVVKDSSNTTVLDKTFPPAANGSFELPSAKTGKWQVTVTYAGFTGDLMLSIAKHQSTSTATPTPTHTTGPAPTQTTTAAGTSTSSAVPTDAPSATTTTKGAPGVGLLLLLAALGAGVAIRRRL